MSEKIDHLVAPIRNSPGLHYRNPRFPINIKLPDNLECGTKIHIHLAVAAEPNRFAINLKNAETDANNYFHFNPRFDEGAVVRNSRLDEAWGDEERDGEMPFIPGEPFLITITPAVDCFEVEVNGNPFITYNHRDGMPLCDVTHISMWGDVTVYGIHVPLASMPIPLVLRIPQNTYYGDALFFTGDVPDGAARFQVNFQCGTTDDADIMYHFNPRLDDSAVVCNNRIASAWGDEETFHELQLAPGDPISGSIVVAREGYMPFLNNNALPTFAHRINISGAYTVLIDGDVRIGNIIFDCPPVRLPPQVPDIDIELFEEKTEQVLHSDVPVTMSLQDGFAPGKAIYVSGKISDEPERVVINLQCGESEEAGIALHLNPRWDDGPDIVFNSFDEDAWGEEVREPNPLPAGSDVEFHILCLEDAYCILFNGDVVANIPHRFDVGRVTHISVDGSIYVYRILAM